MHDHSARIAAELNLSPARVAAAIALIDEGNTCLLYTSYSASRARTPSLSTGPRA